MSDRDFIVEIKRGLLIIMRAMLRRYGMTWLDFLPREFVTTTAQVAWIVDETLVKP